MLVEVRRRIAAIESESESATAIDCRFCQLENTPPEEDTPEVKAEPVVEETKEFEELVSTFLGDMEEKVLLNHDQLMEVFQSFDRDGGGIDFEWAAAAS